MIAGLRETPFLARGGLLQAAEPSLAEVRWQISSLLPSVPSPLLSPSCTTAQLLGRGPVECTLLEDLSFIACSQSPGHSMASGRHTMNIEEAPCKQMNPEA